MCAFYNTKQGPNYIKLSDLETDFLSLTEVKNFLKVDGNDEDDNLMAIRNFAIDTAERFISSIITPKQYEYTIDKSSMMHAFAINAYEIVFVEYESLQLDPSDYVFSNKSFFIITNDTIVKSRKPVKIIFNAGISRTNAIPLDLKMAIVSHIVLIYENSFAMISPSMGIKNVYNRYRDIKI